VVANTWGDSFCRWSVARNVSRDIIWIAMLSRDSWSKVQRPYLETVEECLPYGIHIEWSAHTSSGGTRCRDLSRVTGLRDVAALGSIVRGAAKWIF
jgi:hypothetical protein